MSNQEVTNVTEMAIKPTSPLQMLSEEQRHILNSRFNSTWIKPREKQIAAMQTSTGFSFQDACFAVSLIEDADTMLKNKRISRVADTLLSNASDVLKGNEDVKANALRSVTAAYETLSVFEAPLAGKRFVDLLFKSKSILKKDAIRIQDLILAHLEIEESEWR